MLHKLRQRAEDEKGFTLIELLVVVLIIGILAAIAIPSFLSQRDKAHDAAAKSDVRTAQTAEETCATDNDGSYTGCDAAKLKTIETTLNGSTLTSATPTTDGKGYTVLATSTTGHTFSITRAATGEVTRTQGGGLSGSW